MTETVEVTTAMVPLDQIEPHGVDVRSSLKVSLEKVGQRDPVKLRLRAGTSEKAVRLGLFVIEDGRHRIAAAKHLGWKAIRAEVRPLGSGQKATQDRAEGTLVSNVLRDRNMAAEATAVASLLEKMTEQEIHERTGVPLRIVKELAAMRKNLVPEAFEQVRSGQIKRAAAKQMLKLSPEHQQRLVKEAEPKEENGRPQRVTIKEVQSAVRAERQDLLASLDQIDTPPLADFAALADQVDATAQKFAGEKRKVLVAAAAILREGE